MDSRDSDTEIGRSRRAGPQSALVISVTISAIFAQIVRTLAENATTTEDPLHFVVQDSDEDEDFDWNKNLTDSKVIPDVIPAGVQYNVKILFDNEAVKYGNILVPFRVKEEPMFVGWPSDRHKYYTIIMTDPDNPEPEDNIHAEWLHWIIVDVQDANRNVCRSVVPYQKPQQNDFRKLKGMHRYVIAVYEQPHGNLNVTFPLRDEPPYADRAHFSSKYFVEKYELKPACAANYFRINWM